MQLRELGVIKRSGRRIPFERDKLERSVEIALRKRPVDQEQIEELVSRVVRKLEGLGENEVQSSVIGEYVMEELKAVDDVAYVRFASVYRDFREARDFETAIAELANENTADDEILTWPPGLTWWRRGLDDDAASCRRRSISECANSAAPGRTRPSARWS